MLVDNDAGRNLQPCLRRQFDVGQDADADNDQIGLDMPPVAEATPVTLLPSLSMLVTCTPR